MSNVIKTKSGLSVINNSTLTNSTAVKKAKDFVAANNLEVKEIQVSQPSPNAEISFYYEN